MTADAAYRTRLDEPRELVWMHTIERELADIEAVASAFAVQLEPQPPANGRSKRKRTSAPLDAADVRHRLAVLRNRVRTATDELASLRDSLLVQCRHMALELAQQRMQKTSLVDGGPPAADLFGDPADLRNATSGDAS